MQECDTGTDQNSFVKRVTVRSGGAGHAHSGVMKGVALQDGEAAPLNGCVKSPKQTNGKIVPLGR